MVEEDSVEKEAVVIPRTLQKEITAVAHRLTHVGIQKSTKYIRDRFFWFKMNRTIEDYCLACDVCVQNKRRAHRREPLTPMRMETHEPRCTIAADIATLPWSSGGYRYLLTIVDLFSKLVEIVRHNEEAVIPVSPCRRWGSREGYSEY